MVNLTISSLFFFYSFALLWTDTFFAVFISIYITQSLTNGPSRKISHNLERFGSTVIQWVAGCTNLLRLAPYVTCFMKNVEIATCGYTMLTTKA